MKRKGKACVLALWASVMLISVASAGTLRADDSDAPKVVPLVIDYGDGVQKHFTQIAWRDAMTVLDLLSAAQEHPRGIRFKHRGAGATAFLVRIDDQENEGGNRNWVYRVNGKFADQSFAVFTLKPGDTVLWKFGEYR